MTQSLYIWSLAALLVISGFAHILAPAATERFMSRPSLVRVAGSVLLALGIACLVWRGWYFATLCVGLTLSGAWRLFFPLSSIRAQRKTYPRQFHGCLLLGGAIMVWALRP